MGLASRLSAELTPDHIGRRATVRVRLPGGGFRDIVGVLESWQDGLLRMRRRDGTVTEVTAEDVAGSRIVPQQPPTRRRGSEGPPTDG
ncbi:putative acetyltransferase [Streptomonospora litoralis]|uniref:Histone acetyltransferase Rv0428c-like SH3 domain-containing protein n=1 Tax=Streptomonospora litoralis TaxID=2498135 RepID=A0A4P6PWU4_9ACTN|nr:hypothetical protein [Streptomonospora litoralis]QBI52575.1 hypothetical protein EKD16_03825 [Streptomonospora litoralis]